MEIPNDSSNSEGRTVAIISYLTVIGLIIAIVLNEEKKHDEASFHIRQSMGLFISIGLVLLLTYIPVVGNILASIGLLYFIVLWGFGIVNAVFGHKRRIPTVGLYYEKVFSNL
ncbi:DUF4870 domain-containing protein [Sphingobacterium sp. HJSM2_6]|uniref:DUF4870 domain-containing protein n=1 Tax=Sphingobacterium sp. HJSM2_6 TaxID=3366264 RepID=UPI003BC57426